MPGVPPTSTRNEANAHRARNPASCGDFGSSGPDPDGVTRINGWDLLTAICLTVPLPMQDRVELLCESGAGGLAGRLNVTVRIGLLREANGYIFTVEDDGPGFLLQPDHARSLGLGLVMAIDQAAERHF